MNDVTTLYKTAGMQQHDGEFNQFLEIIKRENVRSYLEIGCKWGGTLWRVACALPKGSKIVAVDLPHGKRETEPHLLECVNELRKLGYDVSLFLTDSTDAQTIEAVGHHAPFDLVFIDANHTEPYVRKDWANYGPMGRMVAFHDIGWIARPQPGKLPIDVPRVWNEIKADHRHIEIKECPRDNGIGVLWRNHPTVT